MGEFFAAPVSIVENHRKIIPKILRAHKYICAQVQGMVEGKWVGPEVGISWPNPRYFKLHTLCEAQMAVRYLMNIILCPPKNTQTASITMTMSLRPLEKLLTRWNPVSKLFRVYVWANGISSNLVSQAVLAELHFYMFCLQTPSVDFCKSDYFQHIDQVAEELCGMTVYAPKRT